MVSEFISRAYYLFRVIFEQSDEVVQHVSEMNNACFPFQCFIKCILHFNKSWFCAIQTQGKDKRKEGKEVCFVVLRVGDTQSLAEFSSRLSTAGHRASLTAAVTTLMYITEKTGHWAPHTLSPNSVPLPPSPSSPSLSPPLFAPKVLSVFMEAGHHGAAQTAW